MSGVTITKDIFGKTKDGKDVSRFTFVNKNSVTIQVLDYGCIITDILVPDRNGNIKDVNLGFDDMEGYQTRSPYFGAVIGRVANRIAGGKFTLDGKEYSLPVNNGPNSLHGGVRGFDKAIWDTTIDGERLILKYVSADGEEGYPGEVTTTVSYHLSNDNVFSIEYTATATKATPINLTNHAYFNLAGQETPNLEGHMIQLLGDHYTPLDENTIPTGEVAPVDGTPMDLRKPVSLTERMKQVNGGLGFDHNYCVGGDGKLKFVARVEHTPSGRVMDVCTTEPGLQCYTSKNMKPTPGKSGTVYQQFCAFCLEAQHYPDSVHHSHFPNSILRPDEVYQQTTTYKFGVVS